LPGYMVPVYIVSMDRFPLTANGKVDLGALPQPSVLPVRGQGPGPRDVIEEKLAGIWAEVLGIDQHSITIDANFFQLGGHSLKVTSLVANLYKVFKVRLPMAEVFNSPTIEELAKRIKEMSASKYFSVELAEEREYYPLTPAQLRMYFIWRMESAGTAYNSFQCLVLEGELDLGQFKGVFKQLTRRHKSLRTSFEIVDDQPVQRIHKEVEVEVKEDEGTGGLAPLPEESYLSSEFIRPFDLARVPLLRVGLVRVQQCCHLLMLDMHHIITDAISMEILASDFILLYRGKALPELRLQYIDYTQWQNSQTVKTALEHQESYWLKTFAGEIPILNLPTDYARNPGRQFEDFQGSTIEFSFTEEETRELKEITLKQGVTLQMFLSAVFYILLWKLTGQEDIIIGTPAACRRHPDLEHIVGLFINTLALRGFPTGIKTFIGFLQEVKTNFLQAYENQDYPFDRLVEKVVKNRESTRERSPLLDIMFEFRGEKFQPGELPGQDPGLTMKPYARKIKTTIMDMDWFGIESENQLYFTVIYSTGLFKRERIEKMIQRFREILHQVLAKPGIKLGDIMMAHDYAAAQSAVTRIDHGEFEF
jgi:acyl carrier protein